MSTPRLSHVARAADVLVGAGLSLYQLRTVHPIPEGLTMNTATVTVPTVQCRAAALSTPDDTIRRKRRQHRHPLTRPASLDRRIVQIGAQLQNASAAWPSPTNCQISVT